MRHISGVLVLTVLLFSATLQLHGQKWEAYVEPRIGTAPAQTHTAGLFGKGSEELGQTLPAVLMPHGMNFWAPQTRDTERKCVAPYYYNDGHLQGFRNSHWLVGGCTQDFGSFTIAAMTDTLRTSAESRATRFYHAEEAASPSYYAVNLPDEHLQAEMTATTRGAMFRFTPKRAGRYYITVNPNSDEAQGMITINQTTCAISGENPVHRIYQGKGQEAGFSGYFYAEPSLTPVEVGTFANDSISHNLTQSHKPGIGAYWAFDLQPDQELLVRCASSFVSAQGAETNLRAEIQGWDFDNLRNDLEEVWQRELKVVEVEGATVDQLTQLYSALYRTAFLPLTLSDADGRYPSFAGGKTIEQMPDGEAYYEDFSLWDTYRALHPLFNLLHPQRNGQMIQSLVLKYLQGGWMPIFPCWNSYTAAMIGDHAASVVADAYVKGVRNFDVEAAYRGARQNAFQAPTDSADYRNGLGRRALSSYLKYGYIPLEDEVLDAYHTREQTARTLEYAYDDFALSQLARSLRHEADADTLLLRSLNYKNVIDTLLGYVNGRHADGNFAAGTNPFVRASFITEGAPCHYTWYAPHDPYGLINALGGREKFLEKLDSMFTAGRYWHGNEPCHQVSFMAVYAGAPWLTQRYVRHILDTEYLAAPGGLSGNDDAGQMSAWQLFAMLGFYPVCPATPYYIIASPVFPRVTLGLENGRKFTIEAENASPQNIYIQSATLNGHPYPYAWLSHETLMKGGTLRFIMGSEPNKAWGSSSEMLPPDTMKRNTQTL